MHVTIDSTAGAIIARLDKRAAAMRDLKPALQQVAAEVDRVTAENLTASKDSDGKPFDALAEATLIGRLRRRKGAWRKATKGAKARQKSQRAALREGKFDQWKKIRADLRERVLAAAKGAGFKPLLDTGRGRASARAKVVGRNAVRWSIVDYMIPHISGGKGGRPPERNFSIFRRVGDRFELHPRMAAYTRDVILRHIARGT